MRKNGWVKDFTPKSQDNIAIALIKQAGANVFIETGDIEKAIPRLTRRWSSLPGGSQINKNMPTLQDARALFDKFAAEIK
jgi:muramidase (phage lysozyme)